MQILGYIIQKEFIQIFRNKAILFMMTLLPIIQLIVLSSAASNEVKNINVAIIDADYSEYSRLLIRKIDASNRMSIYASPFSKKDTIDLMKANKIDIILEIPIGFEKKYLRGERPKLQLSVNAINGQQATVGSGYLSHIIRGFNREILADIPKTPTNQISQASINVVTRNWYNPFLKYTDFMVPGILAELTVLLTMLLTAMNIVREKEIGTIEQINVTPIKKWQFIVGKMVPFLGVGLVLLTVGLLVGKLLFNIPLNGSLLLIFGYAIINLIAVLGLGLLISNFAETQQQAIFIAFFFVLIFILMCGLFTPIDSMPGWAQIATIPNPLAHFISVSRKVLMKGSGLADIRMELIYISCLAIVFNALAVWSYKKQK